MQCKFLIISTICCADLLEKRVFQQPVKIAGVVKKFHLAWYQPKHTVNSYSVKKEFNIASVRSILSFNESSALIL